MRGHPLSGRLPATPTEVSEQIPPLVLSAPGRGLTLNRSRHCFSLSLATETARAILNILTKSYKPTFSSKETAKGIQKSQALHSKLDLRVGCAPALAFAFAALRSTSCTGEVAADASSPRPRSPNHRCSRSSSGIPSNQCSLP